MQLQAQMTFLSRDAHLDRSLLTQPEEGALISVCDPASPSPTSAPKTLKVSEERSSSSSELDPKGSQFGWRNHQDVFDNEGIKMSVDIEEIQTDEAIGMMISQDSQMDFEIEAEIIEPTKMNSVQDCVAYYDIEEGEIIEPAKMHSAPDYMTYSDIEEGEIIEHTKIFHCPLYDVEAGKITEILNTYAREVSDPRCDDLCVAYEPSKTRMTPECIAPFSAHKYLEETVPDSINRRTSRHGTHRYLTPRTRHDSFLDMNAIKAWNDLISYNDTNCFDEFNHSPTISSELSKTSRVSIPCNSNLFDTIQSGSSTLPTQMFTETDSLIDFTNLSKTCPTLHQFECGLGGVPNPPPLSSTITQYLDSSRSCGICGTITPQIYVSGWFCSNESCERFYLDPESRDMVEESNLIYMPWILSYQPALEKEERVPQPLQPLSLQEIRARGVTRRLNEDMRRGLYCSDCGRMSNRIYWGTLLCQNPSCQVRRCSFSLSKTKCGYLTIDFEDYLSLRSRCLSTTSTKLTNFSLPINPTPSHHPRIQILSPLYIWLYQDSTYVFMIFWINQDALCMRCDDWITSLETRPFRSQTRFSKAINL